MRRLATAKAAGVKLGRGNIKPDVRGEVGSFSENSSARQTAFCERCGVASSQPTPTIINTPTISVVAAMKTAVSNGVIIQLVCMVRPQLSDVAP
jgi:hypothetical protein